jgi:hypothetical protein
VDSGVWKIPTSDLFHYFRSFSLLPIFFTTSDVDLLGLKSIFMDIFRFDDGFRFIKWRSHPGSKQYLSSDYDAAATAAQRNFLCRNIFVFVISLQHSNIHRQLHDIVRFVFIFDEPLDREQHATETVKQWEQ